MDNDKPQKVSIGFQGGPVLSARVRPTDLKQLRDALPGGGWHDLKAEEGAIAVQLDTIVYVLADTEAHRVGFGG